MDVEQIIDRLYALPPDRFTAARDAEGRELRKAGRRAEAAYVEEQRKPTAGAAAVNQLVRARRADVDRFLESAEALREAQVAGGTKLRAALKRERDALGRLVRIGGTQVRQSLEAAAVDRVAAEQLLGGRLVQELEPAGFGTLLEHAKPSGGHPARVTARAPAAPKTKVVPKPTADDHAARARLARARQAYAAAKTEARRAERSWSRARDALARAEAAVAKAQAALERGKR